jgi:hypothetical protein
MPSDQPTPSRINPGPQLEPQWYGYGTWDSIEDFELHMKSDHVMRLHQKLGELRVFWRATALYKIGDQDE